MIIIKSGIWYPVNIRISGCGVSDERNTQKDSSVLVSAASCNYLYSGIWKRAKLRRYR